MDVWLESRGRESKGSLLFLTCNLGDKTIIGCWIENPHWQYFCTKTVFQKQKYFASSEFIHFRHRIEKEDVEKFLKTFIKE